MNMNSNLLFFIGMTVFILGLILADAVEQDGYEEYKAEEVINDEPTKPNH